MERAQALGLQFCKDNFPTHPAIVCTHPDGHNNSGNIHVHIVIGSIRMREVERKPYMQKPRDWREGMKHSSTAQTMRHLRDVYKRQPQHRSAVWYPSVGIYAARQGSWVLGAKFGSNGDSHNLSLIHI